MAREFRVKHEEISDSQTITDVNERKFKEQGLDIHVNEVDGLEDDFKKKERIYKVRNTKFFIVNGLKKGGGTDGT